MDSLLRGPAFAYVYLDDVLIALRNKEEDEGHVREVIQWLEQAGLTLRVVKCTYTQPEVQ